MDRVKTQLLLAFNQPGCPLCRLRQEAEYRYMLSLLGERLSDDATRQRLHSNLGLCHTHTWTLQALERQTCCTSTVTGMLYAEIAEQVLEALKAYQARALAADTPDATLLPARIWNRLKRWLGQPRTAHQCMLPSLEALLCQLNSASGCPACEVAMLSEMDAAENLVRGISDATFRAAYTASDGLCLFHLRSTLEAVHNEVDACFLVETTARKLGLLAHDLNEFLRKHSWQYHHEPRLAQERVSWIRAVAFMVGEASPSVEKHLYGTRREAQLAYRHSIAAAATEAKPSAQSERRCES